VGPSGLAADAMIRASSGLANALGGSGVTLDQRFLADGMRVTGNLFCHFVRVVPQVPGIDGIITITTSVQCDS
jgi:hypothetical protein